MLGLDLQGGISVVLAPEAGATHDDLLVIRDLIRDELENRGIAEPDVRVEGSNIIVDLPGVKDQRDALDAVDVAGIVHAAPGDVSRARRRPTSRAPRACRRARRPRACRRDAGAATAAGVDAPRRRRRRRPRHARLGDDGRRQRRADRPASPSRGDASSDRRRARPVERADSTRAGRTAPDDRATTTTTTLPPLGPLGTNPVTTTPPTRPTARRRRRRTTHDQPAAARRRPTCLVGPVQRGPRRVRRSVRSRNSRPSAELNHGAGLDRRRRPDRRRDADVQQPRLGSASTAPADLPDRAAGDRPRRRHPVGADGAAADLPRPGLDQRQLQRGVRGPLARPGAQPRRLPGATSRRRRCRRCRPRSARTRCGRRSSPASSASCSCCSMLIVFYRRLDRCVVMAGIIVWGMLIYSASAIISQTTNYALTLAGVTGIIVSIGITVDSYVVYFERLKDEVRHGRTFRNSATAQLQGDVAHDPRRRPRVVHRRRRAVRPQRRFGARLRPLPRRHHGVRPDRAAGSSPARRSSCSPTPAGSTRATRSASRTTTSRSSTTAGSRRAAVDGARSTSSTTHPSRRGRQPSLPGQRIAKRPAKRLVPRADGDRLLGPPALVASAISLRADRRSASSSLSTRGLNLGIDFEGGVACDVPAGELSRRRRRAPCSTTHGIDGNDAKVEERASTTAATSSRCRSTTSPRTSGSRCRRRSPRRAGVDPADVSVAVGVVVVGRADHAQGGHRPARVPRC